MKSSIAILSFLLIFSIGCSKDGGGNNSGAGPESNTVSVSDESFPRIVQARIAPENATSSQPVVVQYLAEPVEGMPVKYTFRWYVDGSLVPEVKENILSTEFFRKGSRIEAEIIPRIDGQDGRSFRSSAIEIRNTAPAARDVELSPVPAFTGDQISANPKAEDTDGDSVTFLYQWEVNGAVIPEANGQMLSMAGIKKNSRVSVRVIPFDGEERGEPVQSPSLTISNKAPEITSSPSSGSEPGKYAYQVKARDADGDALSYSLETAPAGMTINPSSGLITWSPKPVTSREEITVKVAVSDGDGGTAYQEYSLVLEPRYQ